MCWIYWGLLGFGWGRVVRWDRGDGVEIVYFVVILGVSLSRGLLGFVRRGGSNGFGVSEWILWRVSRVELLCLYGKNMNKL